MAYLYSSRREQRQAEAKKRQEEASKRTPEQQLARLDSILGKGKGARKERAKLVESIRVRIEKEAEAKKAVKKSKK